MKKKIIIISSLNTMNFKKKRLEKEWIDYRIDIFMKFTMKSLKQQTNQDFQAFILYEKESEVILKEALAKYEKLPDNIQFTTLKESKQIADNIRGYDFLYLVRIDSDDMYHKSYIQKLHDYMPKEETQVLINQNGYLYDSLNHRLSKYYNESPSPYTLIYKTKDYLANFRYKLQGGHPGAIKLPHEIMDGINFVVTVHAQNTSTQFRPKNHAGAITDPIKVNQILEDYMGK